MGQAVLKKLDTMDNVTILPVMNIVSELWHNEDLSDTDKKLLLRNCVQWRKIYQIFVQEVCSK